MIELAVDGDHSGGQFFSDNWVEDYMYRYHEHVQWYWVLGETYDNGPHLQPVYFEHLRDWFVTPPYAGAGGSVHSAKPTISVTEVYVTAFDLLIWNDPQESRVSALYPGKTIGLYVEIIDRDDYNNRTPTMAFRLGSAHMGAAWGFADNFIDVLLLGPGGEIPDESAVESITWGRIKAHFVK